MDDDLIRLAVIGCGGFGLFALQQFTQVPDVTLVGMAGTHRPAVRPAQASVSPLYQRLPPAVQKLHLWAEALPHLEDAENSQREWSTEYFAEMHRTNQTGSLGAIPLIVLTRVTAIILTFPPPSVCSVPTAPCQAVTALRSAQRHLSGPRYSPAGE
jgi:hypothetical protein